MSDNPEKPYKVGKGKPPTHTQYKKGEPSAHPQGRTPGRLNRSTILRKVFGELVDVNVGGRKKRMPSGEAATRVLMQTALKGNLAAIRDVMKLWIQAEEDAEKAREPVYPFTDKDREVINAIHGRLTGSATDHNS